MTDSPAASNAESHTAGPGLPEDLKTGHTAVCGLQYGDEGKGQIIDMLSQEGFDFVVRYNGGANAGHSVHIGDEKFALHLLPSGILSPAIVNVVGNGVVMDPQGILKEIDGLTERGVVIKDNLRISERTHVVLPYHKKQDELYDRAVSAARGDAHAIGTTGRGIGPCYADKALRSTAIRVCDLMLPADRLREKLRYIVRVKNAVLTSLASLCGAEFEPFDADALTDEFLVYADRLRPFVCDASSMLRDQMAQGKRVLFEGANATLLDIDHGTYPFVTSSTCTALGVYAGAGVPGGVLEHVLGIVKLYTSRVGGGPFPTELSGDIADQIRDVGREYGTTTGRPRRVGWLDLVATRYTAAVSGVTGLACTGLSVLSGLDEMKVCVGYKHNGQTITTMPADADVIAEVQPVFETFEGIGEPVSEIRSYAKLPAAAKRYVEFVESFVGVPIRMVCVGRRRDQILHR